MTKIITYDSTLRDGEQSEGVTLSLEDKLRIARRLDAFGIDVIELGHDISEAPLLACLRRAVEATEAFGKRVQSLGPDIYWWQPRKVR